MEESKRIRITEPALERMKTLKETGKQFQIEMLTDS